MGSHAVQAWRPSITDRFLARVRLPVPIDQAGEGVPLMGCHLCGAVPIPQSEPALCPECFISRFGRRCVIGIDDVEVPIDEALIRWRGSLSMAPDVGIAYDGARYAVHSSDLDHPVFIDRETGQPTILYDGYWMSWTAYLSILGVD
jgi:hypothetical protein